MSHPRTNTEALPPEPSQHGDRLESWKEIAAYLNRDVSTVQRWEKRAGLPIHRLVQVRQGTVYAYRAEIEAWRSTRDRAVVGNWVSRLRLAALTITAAAMAVGAGMAWRGFLKPVPASDPVHRRLWVGPSPAHIGAVSPDGLYFSQMDKSIGRVTLIHIETGKRRPLGIESPRSGEAVSQVFSPDGIRLAYAWEENASFSIRVVVVHGSEERVLYLDRAIEFIEVMDWSPDGNHILACFRRSDGTSEMALISVADGSARVVKTLGSKLPLRAAFAPSGRHISYDLPARAGRFDRDLFLLDLTAGQESREIPLLEGPGEDTLVDWSPDEGRILFLSDRSGALDMWSIRVAAGKPQGDPLLVRKGIGRIWPLGFARGGSFYYRLHTGMTEVFTAGIEGGKLLASPSPVADRMIGANRTPDWSADGHLAYVSHDVFGVGRPQIAIQRAGAGERVEVRPNLSNLDSLRWSADGRFFLATGYDRNDRSGVFHINARSGETYPLVQSDDRRHFFHHVATSPDGNTVYYKIRSQHVEPGSLWAFYIPSRVKREVVSSVYRFDLSRDGRTLAFSTFDAQREYIAVIPAGGGPKREVHGYPRSAGRGRIYSIAWSPGGDHLLFARAGQLWRVPCGGGEPESLGYVMEALRELRPHPDGARVAFTAGADKGEVWVMENFLSSLQ